MASPQLGTESEEHAQPLPPVKLDPLAGLLSYLIPGMGQVYQGRSGQGLLFFFGLYLLFFYGMWMGQWRNVWLPDVSDMPQLEVGGYQFRVCPAALVSPAVHRPVLDWRGRLAVGGAIRELRPHEECRTDLRQQVPTRRRRMNSTTCNERPRNVGTSAGCTRSSPAC